VLFVPVVSEELAGRMGIYGDQKRGRVGWRSDVKEADNGVGGCGRDHS